MLSEIRVSLLLLWVWTSAAAPSDVLMILIDDFRPQADCFEEPGIVRPDMFTPNICDLAAESLVLQRQQVAMSTCSPSRTAMLTGRHTSTTHIWDLVSYFRNVTGNFTTIPQFFKEKGYRTYGMGKIFHPGTASGGKGLGPCAACKGSNDLPYSWTEPYFTGVDPVDTNNSNSWVAVPASVTNKQPLQDTQIATNAVQVLKNISTARSNGDHTPFLVAVGFHKPHLPFVFPERFLEKYPQDVISEPPNQFAPNGMPTVAWQSNGELRSYHDVGQVYTNYTGAINTTLPPNKVKELRRAYYAAVSYTDDNVGTVMEALRTYNLDGNTVVVLWGDHGWQLGEHGLWDKHTNFDIATHSANLFRVPGLTDKGVTTRMPTESVDIFPSLVDFALGEIIPSCPPDSTNVLTCTEGVSVRSLIHDPHTPTKAAAVSMYNRGYHKPDSASNPKSMNTEILGASASNCLDYNGHHNGCNMGYSMLTVFQGHEVRYTEWVHFPGPSQNWKPIWNESVGTELYNHTVDPAENANAVAHTPPAVLAALSSLLHRSAYPSAGTRMPLDTELQ